jgi:hypothetical protein
MMKHPNRLGEIMASRPRPIDDPTLALAANTTKQQIWKLRTGAAKMTATWAERLASHLGVQWPELMDPSSPEARAFHAMRPSVMANVLDAVGRRVTWARLYRGYIPDVAADRFGIPVIRLEAIEAGREEMTIFEAVTIATKLQVTTDFLLRGSIESLPFVVAEDFRAAVADLLGRPPGMA